MRNLYPFTLEREIQIENWLDKRINANYIPEHILLQPQPVLVLELKKMGASVIKVTHPVRTAQLMYM